MAIGATSVGCYACNMTRTDAVDKLKGFERPLRDLGATGLFLYGSTARGAATETSDLDVFLDIDPDCRFSLLDLVRAKHLIEDELGVVADVTTRNGLHRLLKDAIERDAIRVF